MVTWLLEENIFSERSWDEMVSHFEAYAIPWHKVRIIPFSHELVSPLPELAGPVVCYGSLGVQKLAQERGFTPGVWFDETRFKYAVYARELGDLLLNPDAQVMPISEVLRRTAQLGLEEFFIKPEGDAKQFAGQVQTRESFAAWLRNMREVGYLEDNDFDVVISAPKRLGTEYRCVVVDGQVVAWSVYRKFGQAYMKREITEAALDSAKRAIALYQPAPVFMLDIAETDEGDKVIEYNTFNSAGLYRCDAGAVIDSVNAFVEARD